MFRQLRHRLARIQFSLDKLPHQIVHYTLSNNWVRFSILKMLSPFPGLKEFLRQQVANIRQNFIKKRILYLHKIHPTMKIREKNRPDPIKPESLLVRESEPRSSAEILQLIRKELQ